MRALEEQPAFLYALNKPVIAAIVGLILIALLAIWGYSAYQQRQMHNEVRALIKSTSERLRAGFAAESSTSDAKAPAFDFLGNSAAAEAPIARLRGMDTSSMTALADAADDYLLTAREILRRQYDMHDARDRLASSVPKLSEHIQTDRGAAEWTNEAARLRHVIDKDLRDFRIAVDSYTSLVEKFAASQSKIAPFVEPAVLIDEKTVKDARQAALDAFARADENTKRVTQLESYRGRAEGTPRSRRRK